jgi:hypothetical protein
LLLLPLLESCLAVQNPAASLPAGHAPRGFGSPPHAHHRASPPSFSPWRWTRSPTTTTATPRAPHRRPAREGGRGASISPPAMSPSTSQPVSLWRTKSISLSAVSMPTAATPPPKEDDEVVVHAWISGIRGKRVSEVWQAKSLAIFG